jgi:nucleotide-binding universal stress UspA family protein
MDHAFSPAAIIVGIDGSKAAVHAAIWAIDEAVSRDIPLRLVHVTSGHSGASLHSHNLDLDYARAEHAIHQAWKAVEAVGEPVKLEMEILRGDPASMLIHESRLAAMVCVGQTSHSRRALGSTGSALSRSAHCPVAVIRLHAGAARDGRWIIAVVDDSTRSEAVLRQAADEAQRRKSPLLVLTTAPGGQGNSDEVTELSSHLTLDQVMADASQDKMCTLPVGDAMQDYLAGNAELAQLVVIGADDARRTTKFTGTLADAVLRHINCSVMSVPVGQPHPQLGADMATDAAFLTTNDYVREAEARWVTDGGTLAGDRRWTLSPADSAATNLSVTR